MDSAKLNDWLQVIGMFGVLAGLVFVGLELRQTQEIALAGQYNARAESTQTMYLAHMEVGYDYAKNRRPTGEWVPIEELSFTELNHRRAYSNWVWTTLDNLHFQSQAGFLPDETHQTMERIILSLKGSPVSRERFELRKYTLRPSFVAMVEEMWGETTGQAAGR